MIFINPVDEFIKLIIPERNINPLSTIARVAMSFGFLKITMNVFNLSDKTSNQFDLDNGVKRFFVAVIAEGVSEHKEILQN